MNQPWTPHGQVQGEIPQQRRRPSPRPRPVATLPPPDDRPSWPRHEQIPLPRSPESGRHALAVHQSGRHDATPPPRPLLRVVGEDHAEVPMVLAPRARNGLGRLALLLGVLAFVAGLAGLTAEDLTHIAEPAAAAAGGFAFLLALAALVRVRQGRSTNRRTIAGGLVLGLLAAALGAAVTTMPPPMLDRLMTVAAIAPVSHAEEPPVVAEKSAPGGGELPVGETLDLDGVLITVTKVGDRTEEITGNRLTCVTVGYENRSTAEVHRAPQEWTLLTGDGVAAERRDYREDDALTEGPIAPGFRAGGAVCFMASEAEGDHVVELRTGQSGQPTATWRGRPIR